MLLRATASTCAPIDDTMLISYVLDAGTQRATAWTTLAQALARPHSRSSYDEVDRHRQGKLTLRSASPIERATAYAAEDADVTLRLWQVLKPRLVAERMTTVYETLERPLVAGAGAHGAARHQGRPADAVAAVRRLRADARRGSKPRSTSSPASRFNIGSPKQLGDILFGKMGLPGGKKTKTGAWSTDAQVLEDLAAQGHELPRKILDWRQLTKLKSTYTDALPGYVNPKTGRVHTSYALAATTTGRLSSSEPNLQNIPIRTEEGRKIRRAFIAEPGHKLVSADYSPDRAARCSPTSPTSRS